MNQIGATLVSTNWWDKPNSTCQESFLKFLFDSIWDDSNLEKHPTTIPLVNGAFVFGEGLCG
jgi:hypothetical protein